MVVVGGRGGYVPALQHGPCPLARGVVPERYALLGAGLLVGVIVFVVVVVVVVGVEW